MHSNRRLAGARQALGSSSQCGIRLGGKGTREPNERDREHHTRDGCAQAGGPRRDASLAENATPMSNPEIATGPFALLPPHSIGSPAVLSAMNL
jgi:hypothetical protein